MFMPSYPHFEKVKLADTPILILENESGIKKLI